MVVAVCGAASMAKVIETEDQIENDDEAEFIRTLKQLPIERQAEISESVYRLTTLRR